MSSLSKVHDCALPYVDRIAAWQTATIDQAVELSKGCPIFEDGGSVEVRPILKF